MVFSVSQNSCMCLLCTSNFSYSLLEWYNSSTLSQVLIFHFLLDVVYWYDFSLTFLISLLTISIPSYFPWGSFQCFHLFTEFSHPEFPPSFHSATYLFSLDFVQKFITILFKFVDVFVHVFFKRLELFDHVYYFSFKLCVLEVF